MSFILQNLLSFLLVYKYVALFSIAFIAAFIIPVPASTMLVAAGAFAFQGYLNFFMVFFVALLGNVAGDHLGYFLAKRYGAEFLQAIGFRKIIHSKKFKQLEEYIKTNAGSLIFFTRFITEAGPSVNILAGLAGVPYKKYLPYEFIGELLYVLLFGLVGFYLGSHWEDGIDFLRTTVIFMTSLGLLFFVLRIVFFGKRGRG